MLLTPMPVASSDTDENGITQPKGHVVHYFSCLNQRNAVMPLMMLLASCDTNASASGIK